MATVGKVILCSCACMARACFRRDIFLCRRMGRAEVYYGMGAILYGLVGLPAVPISIIILSSDGLTTGGARSHHLPRSIKKTKILTEPD